MLELLRLAPFREVPRDPPRLHEIALGANWPAPPLLPTAQPPPSRALDASSATEPASALAASALAASALAASALAASALAASALAEG